MPVQRAAHKALRQNRVARARNLQVKLQLKKLSIRLRKAITAKEAAAIKTAGTDFMKALDRAAQKKVVHHNTAARKKSRIAAQVRKATA